MHQRLLISLDCLLDTRLGTIYRYRPDLLEPLLAAKWAERLTDDFSVLLSNEDFSWFKEAYENRDVETLKCSRLTSVVYQLSEITNALEKRHITEAVEVESVTLEVNTFPYGLNAEESELLPKLISEYCSLITKVELVSYPLSMITPAFLKSAYSCFWVYDFDEWFTLHYQALMNKQIPDVAVMTPVKYKGKPPTPRDFNLGPNSEVNPLLEFAQIEKDLAGTVNVHYVDMRLFSIIGIPSSA